LKEIVMTALDHDSCTIEAARPLGWLARVANMAAGLLAMAQNRKAMRQLGELTDYELHDIGLTRADLRDAFDLPLRGSPTSRLSQIASHRAAEQAARRVA
jgi:uncharacterized protein YjiS (DUF1127 family)